MNREAMEAAVQRLLDRPSHNFEMSDWFGIQADVAGGFLYDDEGFRRRRVWTKEAADAYIEEAVSVCQTTACIAGEVVFHHLVADKGANPVRLAHQLLTCDQASNVWSDYDPDLPDYWTLAGQRLLGLPSPRDNSDVPLFYFDRWPEYYQDTSYECGQLNAAIVLLIDMLNGEVRCDDPYYGGDGVTEWWSQYGDVWDRVSP